MRKHMRNVLTVVIGGTRYGETRFYGKVKLYQANTSFVVLDLINMEKSHCYNQLAYLRDDNDVQRLVTNLFKATTPKGAQPQEPFGDTVAFMLLLALIFYLKYEAQQDEQNFPTMMEMLRVGDVKEDNDEYQLPLDELFERLEMREPDHIAVKYYKTIILAMEKL